MIGGYGLGFTLRAALAAVAADATVTVAEIVPEVIAWARGPMKKLTAGCLDDPRVMVIEDDVAMLIDTASEAYDAILLDVDNGPDGLTRLVNDALYSCDGLTSAKAALPPGGILAIWSAPPDSPFANRLRKVGFLVDELDVSEAANDEGGRHVIWLAKKPRKQRAACDNAKAPHHQTRLCRSEQRLIRGRPRQRPSLTGHSFKDVPSLRCAGKSGLNWSPAFQRRPLSQGERPESRGSGQAGVSTSSTISNAKLFHPRILDASCAGACLRRASASERAWPQNTSVLPFSSSATIRQ